MSKPHTDPLLWDATVGYLRHWGLQSWEAVMDGYPVHYCNLGQAQETLGWDSMVMGMVSLKWQEIKADHLALSGSNISLRM